MRAIDYAHPRLNGPFPRRIGRGAFCDFHDSFHVRERLGTAKGFLPSSVALEFAIFLWITRPSRAATSAR